MADKYYDQQELKEAIKAGEQLLYRLDQVIDQLNSAKGWGLFDMLGGGMFSTFMKRDKMKNAEHMMREIKEYVYRFKRELGDIDVNLDADLTGDQFLGFADYFFDSFFVDFMVQSKIHDKLRDLESFRNRVWQIVADLKRHQQVY